MQKKKRKFNTDVIEEASGHSGTQRTNYYVLGKHFHFLFIKLNFHCYPALKYGSGDQQSVTAYTIYTEWTNQVK